MVNFKHRSILRIKKSHYVSEDTAFVDTVGAYLSTRAIFDTVQKLRENVKEIPGNGREHHVLTGLMICVHCGGNVCAPDKQWKEDCPVYLFCLYQGTLRNIVQDTAQD